jgi:hypothetical protein
MAGATNAVPEQRSWYWGVLIAYFIAVLVGIVFWSELQWWIIAAVALQIAISWTIVHANDLAGIFALGVPAWQFKGVGPRFVLFPFMYLGRLPRDPHQKQFPGEPELIFHGLDKDPLPVLADGREMVRPIRIVTGGPRPVLPEGANAEELNAEGSRKYYSGPLNIQISTVVTGTIRYYIEDFFGFWIQFPGSTCEEKFAEADRQLQDTFIRTIKEEWRKRPIGLVIDEDEKIQEKLVTALETKTQTWAIKIEDVNIYSPDLGHDLSKALAGIGEATAKAQQTIITADADRHKVEQEGHAAANAKLARENRDTDAAEYRAEKLKMTGREVIALEAVPDIVGDNAKFFFGTEGVTQALGLGVSVLDTIKKMEGPKPEGGTA